MMCQLTFANDCRYDSLNASYSKQIELSYYDDIYCCNYVLGTDSSDLSKDELFLKIKLVRDLNIASLVSDYIFVFIAMCFFCTIYRNNDIDTAKLVTLVITTFGSLVDVGITFTIVGIINENNLIDLLFELYHNGCYSENIDHETTILDLQNQFGSILVLDTLEGVLDIISLCILGFGCYFGKKDISRDFATCAEGIHTFMFAVFDLLIISVNVFVFVLPSYNTFVSSYDNDIYKCFEKISIPTSGTSQPHLKAIEIDYTYLYLIAGLVGGPVVIGVCCAFIIKLIYVINGETEKQKQKFDETVNYIY